MTDGNPDRPTRAGRDDVDREPVIETEPGATERPADDRGGFHDTAPNPHDEQGAAKTASQASGAFMLAGGMWPALILLIIAIALILYFVLG